MHWAFWALLYLKGCTCSQQFLSDSDLPHNISEALDETLQPTSPELLVAALARAAPPAPGTTELPPGGVAMTIGQGETHVYSIPSTLTTSSYLSLSECARLPLSDTPLWLDSGAYHQSTQQGGLLSVSNFTGFNGTIRVTAPSSSNAAATWSYQLGFDASATYWQDRPGLFWVDSDFANSLFVTELYKNFSSLVSSTPYENIVNDTNLNATTEKFSLFLDPIGAALSNDDYNNSQSPVAPTQSSVLYRSFCALQRSALLNQNNADFSTTVRSANLSEKLYRGQFLMTGLNRSTNYEIHLAVAPQPGYTGGISFGTVEFVTKKSTSCQLIYNMSMCPETAFSVPGNASEYTTFELTALYDGTVRQLYDNFTKALDQINCNDKNQDARYSVFYGCDKCASAYRDWLCTVAVPRCADWSNNATYLRERLPGESRNRMINDLLRPGKYKEVLPCYWLCDMIATYCPTVFGFMCPSGKLLNDSYGWPSNDGDVSCSYPGAVYKPDASWLLSPSWVTLVAGFIICLFI